MQTHTVLIVDDHALFRDGIASLLRASGLDVVGQASNGAEALQMARELNPQLVLLDVQMPGISGLEVAKTLKDEMPAVKVVMLTMSENDRDLFESVRSGADGYILKDTPGDDFGEMLTGVFEGEAAISRSMATKILYEMRSQRDPLCQTDGDSSTALTSREVEVLQLAASGKRNREIAETLLVSESTVNYHMRNVLAKLHFRNRTEAAAYAIKQGIISNP